MSLISYLMYLELFHVSIKNVYSVRADQTQVVIFLAMCSSTEVDDTSTNTVSL